MSISDAHSSSGKIIRLALLGILLALLGYLLTPELKYYGSRVWLSVKDRFDPRPARYVLFIGNSHTFTHDVPMMVRYMADSANSPYRYDITSQALPGTALEDHWKNPKTHDLLTYKWDEVVIHGASGEVLIPVIQQESFLNYGEQLINKAKEFGNQPKLFITWNYDEEYYEQLTAEYAEWYNKNLDYFNSHKTDFYPFSSKVHYRDTQKNYKILAQKTGTDIVNIGEVWEKLRESAPRFIYLTMDGNHSTIQGAYLVALMFYNAFSGDSPLNVTYVPSELSQEDALWIRKVADDYLKEQAQMLAQ